MTVTDAQVRAALDVYKNDCSLLARDHVRRMLEAAEQVGQRQWWHRKSDGTWWLIGDDDTPALTVHADGRYSAWLYATESEREQVAQDMYDAVMRIGGKDRGVTDAYHVRR